jgi:hypothetical protein
LGSDKAIVTGLSPVREVLPIDEKSKMSDAPFGKEAENPVRLAFSPIRILVKALSAGIKNLESDAALVLLSHIPTRPAAWRGVSGTSCRKRSFGSISVE